jgi:hypothetical protein
LVATCAVWVRTSADLPTTFTVSSSEATPSVTFSGTVCVGATAIVRCWRPKPLSVNDTV